MLRVTCGSVHRTSSHFTRYDTVHYTLLAGDGSTVVSDYSASTDKRTVHGESTRGSKDRTCTTHQSVSQSITGGCRVNKAFAYRPLIWRRWDSNGYRTFYLIKEVIYII